MNKNEMNSKPLRAQGGMGLLSRTISIQNPQVSIPLIPTPREEEQRGREGRRKGRRRAAQAREKERERERG